ncbi:hypothetical protein ABD76_13310 [Paenibacillus dendritiformis]|nr:hypothetical protein [Paenibacillus dendritiformis]
MNKKKKGKYEILQFYIILLLSRANSVKFLHSCSISLVSSEIPALMAGIPAYLQDCLLMKAVPVKKVHFCRIWGKLSVKSGSTQVCAKNLYEKPTRKACAGEERDRTCPEGRRLKPFVRHLPLDGRMVRIE